MDLCKTVLTGARADVLDPQLVDDLMCGMRPDAVNVAESNFDPLVGRDVDAGDTCHWVFLRRLLSR